MTRLGEIVKILVGVVKERRRWAGITFDKSSIRVNYGPGRIPPESEAAGGGIIKCQDLIKVFPENLSNPNILYIVSSSLVPYSVATVRLAKKAGAAVVLNQNGVAYPAWMPSGWEMQNKPMKEIMRLADYVFYQSDFCRLSADRFIGKFQGPYEILHNPVDTKVFVPNEGTNFNRNNIKLLLAGTHTHFYRVQSAISTLASLRKSGMSVTLHIAGRYKWKELESEAIEECRSLCKKMGLESNVVLSGAYTQRDAVSLMQSADILLHTKYSDPCPRLVVEAMSCGLPVVYSASGGVPELVGDEAGLGVPAPRDWGADHPPSPDKLAECVRSIVDGYDAFSRKARMRAVQCFDVQPWIEAHRRIFSKLCI